MRNRPAAQASDQLSEENLDSIIDRGDIEACFALFEGASDKSRRALAKYSVTKLRKVYDIRWEGKFVGREYITNEPKDFHLVRETATVTLFLTASFSELKKLKWTAVPEAEHIERASKLFSYPWLDEWAQWLIEENPLRYTTILQLVQSDVCRKPTGEAYTIGLIVGLPHNVTSQLSLEKMLLDYPDILRDDIWALFDVEGNGQFSLAALDKYSRRGPGAWESTLLGLSNSGAISRDRLLDASLRALAKDFAQFRAGWFSRFHEALKPSPGERLARYEGYLLLLGSRIPPTVTFAVKALAIIDKNKQLLAEPLLENIQPVLQAKAKSTVLVALKLLQSVAGRQTDLASTIARLAATALVHEAADVQQRALDIIERFGDSLDEELTIEIGMNSEAVLPSLQARLLPWIKAGPVEEAGSGLAGVVDIKPQASAQAPSVTPISDFEELLKRFSSLLENPEDAIEVEMVLEGLSRLGNKKPEDWQQLVSPLKKRAAQLEKRRPYNNLQLFLMALALTYTRNEQHFTEEFRDYCRITESSPFVRIHFYRFKWLSARLLEGKSSPLLSTPTDRRGFIDPSVLVERYREVQRIDADFDIVDQVLALHRLATAGRAELRLQSKELPGEFDDALRFACGEQLPIGETRALWIAAANARYPDNDCPALVSRFGELGPDAGVAAKYQFSISSDPEAYFNRLKIAVTPPLPKVIPLPHISVIRHLYSRNHSACGYSDSLVRWGSTVWPANLEPFFAEGALQVEMELQDGASDVVSRYLEPMLEAHVELGEMAILLMLLGLSAIDKGVRGMASEAFIVAVDDNRLISAGVSACMAKLLPSGYVKLARWIKALASIATVSTLHADAVRRVIQGALGDNAFLQAVSGESISKLPRDFGGLLELFYELQVAAGLPLDDTRVTGFLEQLTQGGKVRQYSKKLLKLAG